MNIYRNVIEKRISIPGTRAVRSVLLFEAALAPFPGASAVALVADFNGSSVSAHLPGEWDAIAVLTAKGFRTSGEGSEYPDNVKQELRNWLEKELFERLLAQAENNNLREEYAQKIIGEM